MNHDADSNSSAMTVTQLRAMERLSSDARLMGGLLGRTMVQDAAAVGDPSMQQALEIIGVHLERVHIWAEAWLLTKNGHDRVLRACAEQGT